MDTDTDVVVVGAGPVGLFQVFELGLLEMQAHVVDSLPYPGGQCAELYADKPIYDIPSVLRCTGRELVDNLLRQLAPFAPTWHLGQEVASVAVEADGRFTVTTGQGTVLHCKAVVVAGGVGSFQPKRLKLPGLDAFDGTQVLHRWPEGGLQVDSGQHVVVVGNGADAVQAALDLAPTARVVLLHRRDDFSADDALLQRLQAAREAGTVQVVVGQAVGFERQEPAGRLTALHVLAEDSTTAPCRADTVLVLQGLSPRLGPIADWGLGVERKQVPVDTARFQTAVPGIFAVGDLATYPGKKKLIVSGFHEAALAAFGAAEVVFPERRTLLQYTTTSPRLHQLLGVAGEAPPPPPDV